MKKAGHFIQMGGFSLLEGNVAKDVLPERFAKLLMAGKIEFPTVTLEEIEDLEQTDGFSKTIAFGKTLWFVAQCLVRRGQHLNLTLVELLTLYLAVLNVIFYCAINLWMFVAQFMFISSTNPTSSASTTCPEISTIPAKTTSPTWIISVSSESIEL